MTRHKTRAKVCVCGCVCARAVSGSQSDQVTTAVTRRTPGHSVSSIQPCETTTIVVSLSLSVERPLAARLAVAPPQTLPSSSLPPSHPPVARSALLRSRRCKPTHLTTLVADRFRVLTGHGKYPCTTLLHRIAVVGGIWLQKDFKSSYGDIFE